jgi:hypothetical protein
MRRKRPIVPNSPLLLLLLLLAQLTTATAIAAATTITTLWNAVGLKECLTAKVQPPVIVCAVCARVL